MNRTLKIFLAASLGGGIGTMIALSVAPYLWWVGLLIGFMVGYLSYETEKLPAAARIAWTQTKYWLVTVYNYEPNWKPINRIILLLIEHILSFILGIVIIVGAGISPLFLFAIFFPLRDNQWTATPLMLICISNMILIMSITDGNDLMFFRDNNFKKVILSIGKRNIFTVCFYYLPIYGYKAIKMLVINSPLIARTIGHFLYKFIRLIHSDVRLMCGTDALIGVAIGYFSHSVFIGSLTGGLLAVLNFIVIRQRWLKLDTADETVKES